MNNESREITEIEDIQLSNGRVKSFQEFQDIYNEITGKKENISRHFKISHIASKVDIAQLNHRFIQTLEQYSVRSINSSFTIYYADDSKEVFSSFERFSICDESKLNPAENLHIEYNFLIKLPHARDARPYKIVIDIYSTATILNKIMKEHSHLGRNLIFGAPITGKLEIEYIDYAVAKIYRPLSNNGSRD